MSTSSASYRLVVFDAPDEPKEVRDLFVGVTGMHPTDAMVWVSRVPGVWPKPLNEADVRVLLDGLYDLGVAAEAWRVDRFPDFGKVRAVHDVACLDEGLRVKGLRGEPTHYVPWPKFELVSGGRISAEDEYRDVSPPTWIGALNSAARFVTGRRPSPPRASRAMRIPRDPATELILVRKEPFLALRVVASKMNYAYLGPRLRPSSAENFPLLLSDIAAKVDQRLLTDPTLALLRGDESDEAGFPTSQALVDYTLHRLLWAWYRRDRDSDQKTMF